MGDREFSGREAQVGGDLAEHDLARLAAEAGLNAAKAAPDRTGWDFCLEPLETPKGRVLDLAPAAFRWMVQVKSVQGKRPVRITLENLMRMAKDSHPWFIYVAEMEGRDIRHGYMVHVGEPLIAQALRAARKESLKERPRLNKKKIAVQWDGGDELVPRSGAALARRLGTDAGDSPARYQTWKQHIIDTVGYGPARHRVHLQVETERLPELADFFVGARDQVNLKSLQIEDLRFDIPVELGSLGPGVLRGPPMPSMGSSNVSLVDAQGALLCAFPFETRHAASGVKGLSAVADCVTLARPHLHLTVRPPLNRLEMRFQLEQVSHPLRMGSFGPSSEFAGQLLRRRTDRITLRAQHPEGQASSLEVGDLGLSDDVQRSYIQAMADGWWLARHAGLPDDALVAPEQLAIQNMTLHTLRAALSGSPLNWWGTFSDPLTLEPGDSGAIDFEFAHLGDSVLAVALTVVGVATVKETNGQSLATVNDGRVGVEQEMVIPLSEFEKRRPALEADWRSKAGDWLRSRGAANCFLMRGD